MELFHKGFLYSIYVSMKSFVQGIIFIDTYCIMVTFCNS